jgi:hypothetical protein
LIPAALCFGAADLFMPRVARPELLMFGAWIGSGLVIGGAVALSGGPSQPTLSWLAIPVITLSSRFPMRGVVVGVIVNIAILLAVAFGVNADQIIHDPVLVIAPVALLLCVAVLSTPLMRSDIQHSNGVAGGLDVTMSFGVGASQNGQPFDYPEVFQTADAALYRAKREGRDRVCRSDAETAPPALGVPVFA